MESRLFEIKLTRSPIGYARKSREILRGMGLRKPGSTKLLKDTPQIRGMIFKMSHMIEIKTFKSQGDYDKYIKGLESLKEKPIKILSVPTAKSETAKTKKAKPVKKASETKAENPAPKKKVEARAKVKPQVKKKTATKSAKKPASKTKDKK